MKRSLLLTIVSLLPLAAPAWVAATEAPRNVTLKALRDNHRPLLIFAPNPADDRLLSQFYMLASHGDELHERQVLAIPVTLASGTKEPTVLEVGGLTPAEATAARKRFHVAPSAFVVILLGKDGGEKLRSDHPISFETLRETIDAMPMRQDEMRQPR